MPKFDVMISQEKIAQRVRELGAKITKEFAGQPIVVIGVLKGSFIFLADLVRAIENPVTIDFLGVSSYAGTESTGVVKITHDLTKPIAGKHVLIVEDIVDTGLTLQYLVENLKTRNPASLKVACLLDKPSRAKVRVPLEYVGFTIDDEFVVGYGLDYDGVYRNLPHIAIYRGE
jgi:hypoxanthine phosphoribosyltransferase